MIKIQFLCSFRLSCLKIPMKVKSNLLQTPNEALGKYKIL